MREKSDDHTGGFQAPGLGQHLLDQILVPAMHPVKNTDGHTSLF
jgi:hypothetical protein